MVSQAYSPSPEEAWKWGLWKVWGRLRIHTGTRPLRAIEWDPLQFSFLLLWTLTKSNLREERVLLSLEITVHHWGKSGQEVSKSLGVHLQDISHNFTSNQGAQTTAKVQQGPGRTLLASWLTLKWTLSLLSVLPRSICSGNSATHSGLGTLTSINDQNNLLHLHP